MSSHEILIGSVVEMLMERIKILETKVEDLSLQLQGEIHYASLSVRRLDDRLVTLEYEFDHMNTKENPVKSLEVSQIKVKEQVNE